MEEALELFSRPSLPDLYPSSRVAMVVSRVPSRMKRIRMEIMAFLDGIIEEHEIMCRAESDDNKDEGLLDVLLRVQRDGDLEFPISMDNVKAVIADLFLAGSEISATTLQWAMSELVRNPRVMQRAQDEIRQVLKGQETVSEATLGKLEEHRLLGARRQGRGVAHYQGHAAVERWRKRGETRGGGREGGRERERWRSPAGRGRCRAAVRGMARGRGEGGGARRWRRSKWRAAEGEGVAFPGGGEGGSAHRQGRGR
ncbi:hypothetical protein HU200_015670 [Digitaria exilis]|uniref:Cytochrome P450 n=1 Tax=Digitaria exilis TaxID=1010633 RepID=A0A835F8F9_9POAL|nr:hypothetical protein HU200_015670 [Digitaria exilis]